MKYLFRGGTVVSGRGTLLLSPVPLDDLPARTSTLRCASMGSAPIPATIYQRLEVDIFAVETSIAGQSRPVPHL